MRFTFKSLSLSLVAVLALLAAWVPEAGAVSAHFSADSTSPNMVFNIETDPTEREQEFETEFGVIRCDIVSADGTAPKTTEKLTAESVEYHADYFEGTDLCEAFGIEAEYSFNGCHYLFHAGSLVESGHSTGTVDLQCPGGEGISLDVSGLCTVTFLPQTGLGSVSYTNGGGTPNDMTVSLALTNLKYKGEGLLCSGSFNSGVVLGKLTFKAFEDTEAAAPVPLTIIEGSGDEEQTHKEKTEEEARTKEEAETHEELTEEEAQTHQEQTEEEESTEAAHFTADSKSTNVKIDVKHDPTAAMQTLETKSGSVECDLFTASGTADKTASSWTLDHVTYRSTLFEENGPCEAFGLEASVDFNGCHYVFHAGTMSGTGTSTGTVDLVCGPEEEVEVVTATCTLSLPAQSGMGQITYASGGGSPQDITATAHLEKIEYSLRGALCEGEAKDATYDGKMTIKTVEDTIEEAAVGLTVLSAEP